jgi:hypothetical protein
MDKQLPKSGIDAATRAQIFHEQYGDSFDGAAALPQFIIAAGDYISRIVGQEDTDAGMARIVGALVSAGGGSIDTPSEWREALIKQSSFCYSEWQIGPKLHDLAAYAEYGIVLHNSDDPDVPVAHIKHLLQQAQDLEAETPIAQWRLSDTNELTRLVKIARNRWALDNNEPVEPVAMAYFGGVSEGRIRNMMSGADRAFTSDDGRIPALEAHKWLQGRPEFWNSVWREQSLPQYDDNRTAPLQQPMFVPVARDGTMFHPRLRRGSAYTIGKKGEEEQVADFNVALEKLQRMPVAYWRRPNASGNWGSVACVRWERLDASHIGKTTGAVDALGDHV